MTGHTRLPAPLISFFLLLFTFCSLPAFAQQGTMALSEEMVNASNRFIAGLNQMQKNAALFEFDSEERLNWHFIPRDRNGVPYKSLNDSQRATAASLLRTFFSAPGYEKMENVRSLESVLAEIEVNGRFNRDPELYYFSFFGEPSMSGAWGFRYEGHHLAFNWTFAGGEGIASSPQFFGANPAEVRSGNRIGLRALAAEEDMARDLVTSLDANQRRMGVLDTDVPRDILTSANVDIEPLEDQGIRYGNLNSGQKLALIRLIEQVASAQPTAVARARMASLQEAGLDDIRFLWIGGLERGEAHYYRVQGGGILIEYDNTQNNNNHIHLVWRDFDGDFGRDLLQEHYDQVAAVYGPGHQH